MRYFCDNCGTVSSGDIGRDRLCRVMGMDRDYFMGEVESMRYSAANEPGFSDAFMKEYGTDYEHSLELAAMLAGNRVPREEVVKAGLQSSNSVRKGFYDFIKHSDRQGDSISIVTAAPRDFAGPFWRKYSDSLAVIGTRMSADDEDRYCGIALPCGGKSKAGIIRPYVNDSHAVAVGDTKGDQGMIDVVREAGGLGIAFGRDVDADVVLHPGASWKEAWAAGEMYAEMAGERRAVLPLYDVSAMEASSPLGERVIRKLKWQDSL